MSVLHNQHFPIAEVFFFPPNCHSAKLGFCIVLIRELTSHVPNSLSLRGSLRAGLCKQSETRGCFEGLCSVSHSVTKPRLLRGKWT